MAASRGITQLLIAETTWPDSTGYESLADIVRQGYAACMQITPIESVYVWQGELCQEPELRIRFKTTTAKADALRDLVMAAHPYELPAWITWTVEASPTFSHWVQAQTSPTS